MKQECCKEEFISSAYILTYKDKIIDVGIKFTELTGYTKEELLDKEIQYVENDLLRINIGIDAEKKNQETFFIFTKELQFKEVEIVIKTIDETKAIKFTEPPCSSFEERQSYIKQLIENNFTAAGIYSASGLKLLKANQKYLNFLDYPCNQPEVSLGLRIGLIMPKYKKGSLKPYWFQVFETGKSVQVKEHMHISENGIITYWDVTITPVSENNKLKYYVVNNVEVTKEVIYRKQVEKQAAELKQQKEQLEAIFENMWDGLSIINTDGSYRYYNKRALDMVYNLEEVKKQGDTLSSVSYYDRESRKITKDELPGSRVLAGEQIENLILKIVKPNQINYYNFNGCPIYNKNGEIDCAIVCARDMTEYINSERILKLHQEKLFQAEKTEKEYAQKLLKIKEELFTSITHEFKTPLTVINAALQALETLYNSELSENVKNHLKRIQVNTLRQIRLVNNLLDITRFNAGHFKFVKRNMDIVYLTQFITQSVDLFAKQKEVELSFSSDIEVCETAMDEEKYERILLNLLSNAIKFTPKGKKVQVHISVNNNKVSITVKDEGIGIPKDKMKVIFERFGQVDSSLSRQAEGTGIGLSLAAVLVSGLGGTIEAESEEGKGSTFTVQFPVTCLIQEEKIAEAIESYENRIIKVIRIEFSDIYF